MFTKKICRFISNKLDRVRFLDGMGFYNRLSDEKYLKKMFKIRTGRDLDLENPQTYNEKIQWLKLYDRKPTYVTMVDKCEAKKYIADCIGEEFVIPSIGVWDKFDDIDFDVLPKQFVMKCTHDSGGIVIVRDKEALNRKIVRKKINKRMRTNYFYQGREWPYKDIKPRIIIEEYISAQKSKKKQDDIANANSIDCEELQDMYGLLDYKFMCFDGKVRAMFLDIGVVGESCGHAKEYYRNVYDKYGKLLPVLETRKNYPKDVVLPDNLSEMVKIAEKLSKGISHLRVDLYRLNTGEIKVGELTFFHGSGLSNVFYPADWDLTFGNWITLPPKNQ